MESGSPALLLCAMELLLDALPAAVHSVADEKDQVEAFQGGGGFGRGDLEAGEPIRRDAVRPRLRPRGR